MSNEQLDKLIGALDRISFNVTVGFDKIELTLSDLETELKQIANKPVPILTVPIDYNMQENVRQTKDFMNNMQNMFITIEDVVSQYKQEKDKEQAEKLLEKKKPLNPISN